jgi:hypothetical protein
MLVLAEEGMRNVGVGAALEVGVGMEGEAMVWGDFGVSVYEECTCGWVGDGEEGEAGMVSRVGEDWRASRRSGGDRRWCGRQVSGGDEGLLWEQKWERREDGAEEE